MNTNLQQMLKEGKISNKTLERVQIAKAYIEKKYKVKKMKEEEKRKEWEIFNSKLEELNLSGKEKDLIKMDVMKKEAEILRQGRQKISIREFEPLAIIGKGAFGEVRVCREIKTGEIVAIKKMRKDDMFQKNQIMHVRTEKEILTSAKSQWVVNLRYSFQDDYFLYLVMDFLPGGDFMSLLMKKDILTEEEAKFYTAEMVLAVEDVHRMNTIHRDLKPDNILIDKNGHIQLSDFGLSKLSENVFYPMSSNLKEKDPDDTITNVTPSGNNPKMNIRKEDVKNRKKTRLV
jgi:serine/threonine kinase 38